MSFVVWLKEQWDWFLGHEPTKAQIEADVKVVENVADDAIMVAGMAAAIDPQLGPGVLTAAAGVKLAEVAVGKVEAAADAQAPVDNAGK
jgi:hypothetical protein